jgi:hypothetical protein
VSILGCLEEIENKDLVPSNMSHINAPYAASKIALALSFFFSHGKVYIIIKVQKIQVELRRMFGPKKDEVTGAWRKVHNEICNLYSSPIIIRMKKFIISI